MLHIVQVVLSGSAEMPQIFSDENAARDAFVAGAKKYWAQSYAAYCGKNGLDSGSFTAAEAFVAGFDLADRSRIHFWSITPADEPAGGADGLLPRLEALQLESERLQLLAGELEQVAGAVREGVSGLLETVAALSGKGSGAACEPGGKPDPPGPLAAAPLSSPPAEEPAADIYTTREWQEYVESIKNMCGGSRSEYHLFTRSDWRQAVYSGETSFEYWQWVAATIDRHIEKAQQAGYAVAADPDSPGRYRFKAPDGRVSDISCDAEGEAWCRAGLHLDGKGQG